MCDDNKEELSKYDTLIRQIAEENNIDIYIKHFSSGKKMLFYLEEYPNEADIIFQDVIMDELNGIETAKKVREYQCNSEIVFLTNTKSYVFDSFDASPLNYLIKSEVDLERMREIFLKAVLLAERKKRSIFVCERNSITKTIPVDTISHFESTNRIVTVHYGGEQFEFYATLDSVMDKVKDSCVRIHRSYAVNLKHIKEFRKNSLILKNGLELPLGITHSKNAKEKFDQFIQNI